MTPDVAGTPEVDRWCEAYDIPMNPAMQRMREIVREDDRIAARSGRRPTSFGP